MFFCVCTLYVCLRRHSGALDAAPKGIHMFHDLCLPTFFTQPHISPHAQERIEHRLFIQQPTVKPHAPQAHCSIWVMPHTIINIRLVRVNKLDCRRTESLWGLLVRQDYIWSSCRWLQQLVSFLVLNGDVGENKDAVTPCWFQSVSHKWWCVSLMLLGAGLKWGD